MHILAIETSSLFGSIACLNDGDIAAEVHLRTDQRSAQSLAPAINALLAEVGWRPAQLDLLAVAIGPGSFTGLRVGVTTAKTLAYACNAQVCGVNTLAVIARQAPVGSGTVHAVLDAQRRQLFAATFAKTSEGVQERVATHITDVAPWIDSLEENSHVTGAGLKRVDPALLAQLHCIEESHWEPTAGVVGQIAGEQANVGELPSPWELVPQYYRQSAAEEKLKQ